MHITEYIVTLAAVAHGTGCRAVVNAFAEVVVGLVTWFLRAKSLVARAWFPFKISSRFPGVRWAEKKSDE